MKKHDIIHPLDHAILEIRKYIEKYHLSNEHMLNKDFIKLLLALKGEIINQENPNERILRGFKDLCTTTALQYEHTTFNNPIFEVYDMLETYFPQFKSLELLRKDFGSQDPV